MITMMHATYPRYTHDRGGRIRPSFDHTGRGRLLLQGIVDAIVVVVLEVISNEPTQVGFVQHDHVVQEFPATAPHPALRHAVRLSRQLHRMETVTHDVFG